MISELCEPDPAAINAIAALWRACDLTRPWNDPHADIFRAIAHPTAALLIARDPEIVGTVMVGDDGHRGAIYYLAVAPTHQRTGLGRDLLSAAEDHLKTNGCPKLNLVIRAENTAVAAFYKACGYAQEDRMMMAKRLM
ncbi:MAG: GNAT family acetyltransferase [Pseudomonadota bacterium]